MAFSRKVLYEDAVAPLDFYPDSGRFVASGPAGIEIGGVLYIGKWLPVVETWIAKSDGTWENILGPASDAVPGFITDTGYCAAPGDWRYRYSIPFTSPLGNTTEIELTWRVDGVTDTGDGINAMTPATIVFGAGVTGPLSHQRTLWKALPGGIHDGNDHAVSVRWRKKSTVDGLWSLYFTKQFGSVVTGDMTC